MSDKKIILISQNLPRELQEKLAKHGTLRLLPSFSRLPSPVSSHADMLTFVRDNIVYTFDEYYRENKMLFRGLNTAFVESPVKPLYPDDIALDALLIGKYIVCNEAKTRNEIKNGLTALDVRQGYAKCSCLKVSENAVITGDVGIAKSLSKIGIAVLFISSGGIELAGYDCGFIGGASAVTDDCVIFFGDINAHRDYGAIADFITRQGKTIEYIENMRLTDYGGATII